MPQLEFLKGSKMWALFLMKIFVEICLCLVYQNLLALLVLYMIKKLNCLIIIQQFYSMNIRLLQSLSHLIDEVVIKNNFVQFLDEIFRTIKNSLFLTQHKGYCFVCKDLTFINCSFNCFLKICCLIDLSFIVTKI